MTSDPPETDRNVTAFFGSRDAAEQAVAHLVETGVPRDRILLRMGVARKPAHVDDGKGLLQEVKELILPSEEPDAAVEALKHEGFLLSVRPEPDAHDAVFQMLERDGGQGVESREDIWPDWKSGQVPSQTDHDAEGEPDLEAGGSPAAEAGSSAAEDGSPAAEPAAGERPLPRHRDPSDPDPASA